MSTQRLSDLRNFGPRSIATVPAIGTRTHEALAAREDQLRLLNELKLRGALP
jgi:hypothetical protein